MGLAMRRVVKVGGSLINRRDLTDALPRWFEKQPPAEDLVIVGGGSLVNAIREIDSIRPGEPEATHWLCVDLLDFTFRLAASWFDWPAVLDADQLATLVETGFEVDRPTLVSVRSFYGPDRDQGERLLPSDWQTTTDSIAALFALVVDADELVLLKSCDVDSSLDYEQLAGAGIVDEAFPGVAGRVHRVRLEKLPVEH
jgi:aspartokinase-like uncharacterized kinase